MTAIDSFLIAVEAATVGDLDVFADEVVLDATVPNWRMRQTGVGTVRRQLASWFADPGHFEALERTPLPDGELVEFELTWLEGGLPFACHQVHRLRVEGDRIVSDTVFCGGRWPAALLAQMEEASRVAG